MPEKMKALVVAAVLCLAGCGEEIEIPDCLYEGEGDPAPSAGCLVLHDGGLLLVNDQSGRFSVPGGSVESGEVAQCGAQRETFEETSVIAVPVELARTFDNGFRLYWCESVVTNPEPRILYAREISEVGFFEPQAFAALAWRFPEQGALLQQMVTQRLEESNGE